MSALRNGSTRAWRERRAEVLEAAGWRCVREDCDRLAVEVHHVLGVRSDPGHEVLEPLCSEHHQVETARQVRAARRRSRRGARATVLAPGPIRTRRVRLGPLPDD